VREEPTRALLKIMGKLNRTFKGTPLYLEKRTSIGNAWLVQRLPAILKKNKVKEIIFKKIILI
jgi:hypothetical protein